MLDYFQFKEINDLFVTGHAEKARHLLMEMQSRCIALRDEISMLKFRLQNLEDTLFLSQNLLRENKFYWLNINGLRHGPFCPRCYEKDGALIRLERNEAGLYCAYCQEIYTLSGGRGDKKEQAFKAHSRILHFAK